MSVASISESASKTNISFSGHETFTLRYGWLKKAVDGVQHSPTLFGERDAMVTLGVGKNMVRSMRHWALATGMIEESPDVRNNRGRHLQPTDLGRTIFADDGLDPFLERKGTIWLLHYQLASNLGASATWFWAFNHFVVSEFQSIDLISGLERYFAPQRESSVAHATLERDVG